MQSPPAMPLPALRTVASVLTAALCAVVVTPLGPLGCSVTGGEDGAGDDPAVTGNANGNMPANLPDGVKNGDETDVDCGGSSANKCADGKSCAKGEDCASAVCKAGVCASPAPDDGMKNADETDVDCGGTKAPKCATGKGCATDGDCASDACTYDKKCTDAKSCTGHFGGDTCGAGETGAAGAQHESCCTRAGVTDRPAAQGGPFEIDKYLATAGRMRAFVERYQGNLKAWAATNPAGWNDAWTANLPGSMDEALDALGPNNKRGCNVKNQGGRTYWQGPIDGDAAEVSDFTKDQLDEKALNCVPWHLAQALCVSDGGRLATGAEIAWVFENRGRQGGPTTYPWQWKDTTAYNAKTPDPRLAHQYNYETPNAPATMRMASFNGSTYPLDHAFYMAPPGRFPAGANMHGVQDAAGNMLVWTGDKAKGFTWTMSWEQHDKKLTVDTWQAADGPDGYYAIGFRCAKD